MWRKKKKQKRRDICLVSHALCSGGRAEAARHFVAQLLFVLAFLHGSLHAVASQIHLNYAPLCFLLCRWPSSSPALPLFCEAAASAASGKRFERLDAWGRPASNVSGNFSSRLQRRGLLSLRLRLWLSSCRVCQRASAAVILHLKVSRPARRKRQHAVRPPRLSELPALSWTNGWLTSLRRAAARS